MTVSSLIESSLRLIGAIASAETASAAESADALVALNDMMDSWSLNGLLVYQPVKETFTLTPGQAMHTMGVGGNFNSARPTRILEATISDGILETPVKIINLQRWASIAVKTTQSPFPSMLYYEGAYPLEKINLFPIPSVANSLVLYSLKPITSFASIATTISLPPGYTRALRYNLALELAPEYGRDPSAIVAMTAQESKVDLMRQNTVETLMVSDVVGIVSGKSFNWLTGE